MRRNSRLKYLFLMPAVLWVLGFTVYPLLYSLRLSLFKTGNIGQPDVFNGLGNFARAFRDTNAIDAAKVTLIFVIGGVLAELILGLLFAMLFNRKLPGRNALRTMMTLPLFATPVAVGYLFITVFHEEGGLMKNLISLQVPWLSDPNWALASVMIVDIWKWTPFVFIVLLAALQGIPEEYYEAARLETSRSLEMFRFITLPLIQPTIILVLVLRVAEAFKVFDIPFSLTNGGPGTATQTFSMLAYKTSRRFFDFGYGSALAYLLLIAILMIVLFFFNRIKQAYI